MVRVLPIWIVKPNISSVGTSLSLSLSLKMVIHVPLITRMANAPTAPVSTPTFPHFDLKEKNNSVPQLTPNIFAN